MKTTLILGCLSFISTVLANSTVGTTCATAYTTSHTAPVQTTTYHKRTRTTQTLTRTVHPQTMVTPTTTSTETDSITSTYSTTLAIITDTFSTTSTAYETITTEETATETQTEVTTSTSTSTTTIQPSQGFQPINGNAQPGKRKARRSELLQIDERDAVASPVCPSRARGGKRHYATSVICDVVTTYRARTTVTKTAKRTKTSTAPTITSTVTITSTFSSTSTVVEADASTTMTFSTTSTETDTITVTSTTTQTSTATVQATATYYAACAPNNIGSSDSNNFYATDNTSGFTTTYGVGSAYDCCAACIADDNATCAASFFVPSYSGQCTFISDNACSTSNVAGYYNTDNQPGVTPLNIMNSNCGIWQFKSFT